MSKFIIRETQEQTFNQVFLKIFGANLRSVHLSALKALWICQRKQVIR